MSTRALVALGLANALLAGDWNREELNGRARRALGQRPRWLGALVRSVLAAYDGPPRDRRDELALFVELYPLFARAWSFPPSRPRIVRWLIDEPKMAAPTWPVPELATTGELAAFLGQSPEKLDWFADVKGLERFARDEALRNYRYEWHQKPSGGMRVLEAPKARLKSLQRRVLHEILDRIPAHPAAHGFCRGRSTLSFASPHAGRALVVRCDLEDFFASVSSGRVYGIYRRAGYPETVARSLSALSSNRLPAAIWSRIPRPTEAAALEAHWRLGKRLAAPHLPQGAPTSPALANLAAYRLDLRLSGLARALGLAYTRYADDLAFSGDECSVKTLLSAVSAIAEDEGFRVRRAKTRVRTRATRQLLGGWVVNRVVNVPRKELELLEATLINCVRRGPRAQNRAGHSDFAAHLRGRIARVHEARPDRAAKLERIYQTIRWD